MHRINSIIGCGKMLSKSKIETVTLKKPNMTISKITEAVNRSRKVIYNLLNDTKNYEKRVVVDQQLCLIMINEPFYMLFQILAARQKNCLQN